MVFHGKVEAISAAAGNAYSMIPVDNATGNFVKVLGCGLSAGMIWSYAFCIGDGSNVLTGCAA